MIVKDICTTNLDILYDIAKEYGKLPSLPANISRILEKVVIYYEITDVLPFELLALKKLGRVRICGCIDSVNVDPAAFVENINLSKDLSTSDSVDIYKAISYNVTLDKELGTDHDSWIRRIGPIGTQMYDICLTLTGSDILNLYGFKFESIFRYNDDDEFDLDTENIQNRLISGIINATYRVFTNMITEKDVFTDAWFSKQLYSISDESYMLSSLYDNLGNSIKFIDSTPDNINEVIDNARLSSGRHPGREWTVEIVCNTTLAMYFYYIANSIMLDCIEIIDTSDIMTVLSKLTHRKRSFNYIESEPVKELTKAISSTYEEWFDKGMDDGRFDLIQRFMLAPANATIKYTMHIKIYDNIDMDLYRLSENSNGATDKLEKLITPMKVLITNNQLMN